MKKENRIVKLGKNIHPCIKGHSRHELDFLITLTENRINKEPDRVAEYEARLLEFILELPSREIERREQIETLIAEYNTAEAECRQNSKRFYLPTSMWICKVKEFIKSWR